MKGILKSNANNDWFVWYTNTENSNVYEKVLPLIRDFSNWVYYNPTDGLKVEFEIVDLPLPKDWKEDYIKYNITHDFKKVAKLITKQEESSNWDEIFDEFAQFGKGKIGDWLKENFKTPKRK
jgi:hypothetical protein